jgi:excisionase family DNA binding protein
MKDLTEFGISDRDLISAQTACNLLGVSNGTLRSLTNKLPLTVIRTTGGHRRFSRKEIERALNNTKDKGTYDLDINEMDTLQKIIYKLCQNNDYSIQNLIRDLIAEIDRLKKESK